MYIKVCVPNLLICYILLSHILVTLLNTTSKQSKLFTYVFNSLACTKKIRKLIGVWSIFSGNHLRFRCICQLEKLLWFIFRHFGIEKLIIFMVVGNSPLCFSTKPNSFLLQSYSINTFLIFFVLLYSPYP